MTDDEIEKAVIDEYKKTYPKWKSVRVTQKVPDTFGGILAVVTAIDEEADEVDEMCFVFDNGKVQIFESTEQLAIFLESRANVPWYQRVFATSTLSGIVFLLSILLIFISGLIPNFPDRASAVLGAVVGAAAGFYFGSSKSHR
jgi:hypothetical protein